MSVRCPATPLSWTRCQLHWTDVTKRNIHKPPFIPSVPLSLSLSLCLSVSFASSSSVYCSLIARLNFAHSEPFFPIPCRSITFTVHHAFPFIFFSPLPWQEPPISHISICPCPSLLSPLSHRRPRYAAVSESPRCSQSKDALFRSPHSSCQSLRDRLLPSLPRRPQNPIARISTPLSASTWRDIQLGPLQSVRPIIPLTRRALRRHCERRRPFTRREIFRQSSYFR